MSCHVMWFTLMRSCAYIGDLTKRDLPWTATTEQMQSTQNRCIDMRAYNEHISVPSGI